MLKNGKIVFIFVCVYVWVLWSYGYGGAEGQFKDSGGELQRLFTMNHAVRICHSVSWYSHSYDQFLYMDSETANACPVHGGCSGK